MKSELFFNDVFRIAFEGYFVVLLVSYINFISAEDNINHNFANNSISITFFIILLVFVPFCLVHVLTRRAE